MEIKEQAHAKINLGLEVLGKRPNGYHDVHMLMQSLDLCDDVSITKRQDNRICISSSVEGLADDQSNLAYKAAKAFNEAVQQEYGVDIRIEKRIPMAAGLAGGSADAAAVLRGMNRLFDKGLTMDKLCEIGVTIGADVPFCVIEHTAIAQGIGEKLTPVQMNLNCSVLLVKPDFGVSTKAVYEAVDASLDSAKNVFIDDIVSGIKESDWEQCFRAMGNDLEAVTLNMYPVVAEIKKTLLKEGADFAMMSGSGPTVFAIFLEEETCKKAYERMVNLPYDVVVEKTKFLKNR
ncbi:MAG: 4-(cytidine 5'-diphospho)-2-C-methyl-D-erythritol kinase [Eubacterium sp.]|nr:4-(cytidine 5'-diphospho)-2-C-methyl-D-erythritol kinase [Eubacterium sp.]